MKYTIEKLDSGENEVLVRYSTLSPEISQIICILKNENRKLLGISNNEKVVVDISEILYIESVDGRSYAYTQNDVIKLEYTLLQLEQLIGEISFFRCSKSMIINVNKVEKLKSMPSNRIDATLVSGEHIIISRTYASHNSSISTVRDTVRSASWQTARPSMTRDACSRQRQRPTGTTTTRSDKRPPTARRG